MPPDTEQPKVGPNFNPAHLTILERYGGRRGRQLLAWIALGQLAAPAVTRAWKRRKQQEDFTITVPGIDDVYPDLHEWVLERIPAGERKAMIANTNIKSRHTSDGYVERPELRLRYDGSRKQEVQIEGHKVVVAVERENVPERASLPENWRQYMEKITFVASTPAGRDAVVRMIERLVADKQEDQRPPALYMPARWGGGDWTRRGDLPSRSLESTILKSGQLEGLLEDLGRFLASEEEYNRLSQPWHRGYLFHGEPGTGKTSVARALANHFGLPTYYMPLADIDKDSNLIQYVAGIQPRSVLLLEDVDVFHATTQRDEQHDKVSLSAMLNSLDGIWTPHGLITVMTTNNRAALDKALIRAGRISQEIEFTNLDEEQAQRLVRYFGVEHPIDYSKVAGRSPADFIEYLRETKEREHEEGSRTLRAVSA